MKYEYSKGYSSWGAQMGRNDCTADKNHAGKAHLQPVPMSACGCYDPGGAYWGRGAQLWVCFFEGPTERNECFVRAATRDDAKKECRKTFPNISFYR